MSDNIALMADGRNAVAYTGEVPWHGKGQALTRGASVDTWIQESGLNFQVQRGAIEYMANLEGGDVLQPVRKIHQTRSVLYRNDNGAALGIMGQGYKIVQPREILEFYREIIDVAGFELEVAGAINDGATVWALARISDGAPVIGHDVIRPYLVAATSYDGTLSTTFKLSCVRVVCQNTVAAAFGAYDADKGVRTGGEKDKTEGAVVQCVRMPHSQELTDERKREIRLQLGLALTGFDRFLIESRMLAETKVDDKFAAELLRQLLPAPANGKPVEQSRTFKRLMATWTGEQPSATLPEAKGTAWGLLNAITWDVDHVRGSDDKRLASAWFGSGEALKKNAHQLLVDTIAPTRRETAEA